MSTNPNHNSTHHSQTRCITMAAEKMTALESRNSMPIDLNGGLKARINRESAAMLTHLFSEGNLEFCRAIHRAYLEKPSVRVLEAVNKCPKDKDAEDVMMDNFALFLEDRRKKGGTRTKEGEQIVLNLIAAVSGDNLRQKSLICAAARVLRVHPRVVSRGILNRKKLDEAPGTGYVKATRAKYRNAISDQAGEKIKDWMHSSRATRIDNYRKKLVKIYFIDPDTGDRAYVEHPARELLFPKKTLWTLFSGTDIKCEPVPGIESSIEWREVKRMTRTKRRPNGIKGGPHLMTKYSCPCIYDAARSQCSCPYCSHFIESAHVRTQKEMHRGRPPVIGPPRPPSCRRCNGDCNQLNSLWRTFLEDPIGKRDKLFCAPKVIAKLQLIDPDSGLLLDEEKTFSLYNKDCMHHKCADCGWNNRFSRQPMLTAVFNQGEEDERKVQFRGCPYDCRDGQQVEWNEFRKIEHGLCASGKPYITDTWVPIQGTRLQFYGRMHEFYTRFWPHQWSVDLTNVVKQIHDRHFRNQAYLKPTLLLRDPYASAIKEALHKQKHKHLYTERERLWTEDDQKLTSFDTTKAFSLRTIKLAKDFAAKLSVPRKLTKTCQTDPSYNEWVGVIECDPRLYRIPISISRRRLKRSRSQRSEVRTKKYAFFAFSDRKHDAVYDQQCTADMIYIIRHGCLPPGSKSEWFHLKKRLRGSCTGQTLTYDLTEAMTDDPIDPTVLQILSRRDKCTAQYHGLHAFFSVQEFFKRTKVRIHDHANAPRHGRCICDGVSNGCKQCVRTAAQNNFKLEPGCRGLVLYLASKMATPTNDGDGMTGYYFAYYPDSAFDDKEYLAEEGYDGSSKDHFFTGSEVGGNLTVRERWCGCSPCLASPTMWSADCLWKPFVGAVRHHQLRPARPPRVLDVARAGAPLETRVHTLYRPTSPALERVWVSRVHADDPSGRPYFLLRVIQAPWQLAEDSLINGNAYEKDWYVCKIHWFDYIETRNTGDHVYKLLSRPQNGEIISCNVILIRPIVSFDSYRGGKYVLSRETHRRIMRYGDL